MMAANILIVDDEVKFERLIRQLFRKELRRDEYEFTFAHNGIQALEKVNNASQSFDLVLCDINMPEMDGLTFISKLKDLKPDLLPVVVSAYGNMKNIRSAMNSGAFDFVTKPVEVDDLKATILKVLAENDIRLQARKASDLESKNHQLEELDKLKSRFFTNISHEFRTPLTVIGGMIHQIKTHPEEWLDKGSHLIERNVASLLNLINQILDLRKLEAGNLELNYLQDDIVKFLRVGTEIFEALADSKSQTLTFDSRIERQLMDFDPDKLQIIQTNLISNAIKFTPEGGTITVTVSKKLANKLEIEIRDTGRGMPPDQLDKIFDRFYQIDQTDTREGEGTGIGLTFTKELVKLMEGTITVESEVGQGSCFTIQLPITQQAKIQSAIYPKNSFTQTPTDLSQNTPSLIVASEKSEKHSLLIIEDNPDIVTYLYASLQDEYELTHASDGQIGIEMALENIPDLILTDVMMPRKNGFEVCEVLKQDERTSHIPIVMLTAKSDLDSRLEGLKQGADDYLLKPFNQEELRVRMKNLLSIRQKLQERYKDIYDNPPKAEKESYTSKEDSFILKLKEILEEQIDNSEIDLNELSEKFHLSRSQFGRKVKALTGKSPGIFLRSLRLQKARQLLRSTDIPIKEIAYDLGFSNPNYFSNAYSSEFGESPSKTRNVG